MLKEWFQNVDLGTVGPLLVAALTAWLGHKARRYIWSTHSEEDEKIIKAGNRSDISDQLITLAKAIHHAVGVREDIEKRLKETRHEMYNKLQIAMSELENNARHLEERVRKCEIEIATMHGAARRPNHSR